MRYLVADVYYHGNKAGRLSREDGFYRFLYDREYVIGGGLPISFSLPVTSEPYDTEQLHKTVIWRSKGTYTSQISEEGISRRST